MKDSKEFLATRKSLLELSRAQLVALAKQKTNMAYSKILEDSTVELSYKLADVDNVLEPEVVT